MGMNDFTKQARELVLEWAACDCGIQTTLNAVVWEVENQQ